MRERKASFDIIKAIAIFSVFCAHCSGVQENHFQIFAEASSIVLQNIGTAGVLCFFVISGFFHSDPKNGQSKIDYFWKKLYRLGIPWLISSSCVYLYVHLRKPPLSLESWLAFVIGNGSYTYYMTMLTIFIFLFSIKKLRQDLILILLLFVTVISIFCFPTAVGPTPYLNPLNWIGYYAVGLYFRKHKDLLSIIYKRILNFKMLVFVLYLILLAYQVVNNRPGSYWKGINVFVSWCGASCTFILGSAIAKGTRTEFLKSMGKNTLFMYLWHMPIAGIIANIFNRGVLVPFVLIRPFLVYFIMAVAAQILIKFARKSFATSIIFGINR